MEEPKKVCPMCNGRKYSMASDFTLLEKCVTCNGSGKDE